MPLIPFEVNGAGIIEALDDFVDWYTFCD